MLKPAENEEDVIMKREKEMPVNELIIGPERDKFIC